MEKKERRLGAKWKDEEWERRKRLPHFLGSHYRSREGQGDWPVASQPIGLRRIIGRPVSAKHWGKWLESVISQLNDSMEVQRMEGKRDCH